MNVSAAVFSLMWFARSGTEIAEKQAERHRLHERQRDLQRSSRREVFLKQRLAKTARDRQGRRHHRKIVRPTRAPGLWPFRHTGTDVWFRAVCQVSFTSPSGTKRIIWRSRMVSARMFFLYFDVTPARWAAGFWRSGIFNFGFLSAVAYTDEVRNLPISALRQRTLQRSIPTERRCYNSSHVTHS
jgi:hypothetical protein